MIADQIYLSRYLTGGFDIRCLPPGYQIVAQGSGCAAVYIEFDRRTAIGDGVVVDGPVRLRRKEVKRVAFFLDRLWVSPE